MCVFDSLPSVASRCATAHSPRARETAGALPFQTMLLTQLPSETFSRDRQWLRLCFIHADDECVESLVASTICVARSEEAHRSLVLHYFAAGLHLCRAAPNTWWLPARSSSGERDGVGVETVKDRSRFSARKGLR